MKDLIFIGGAKGIGKSTLIKKIKESINIDSISTGNIVVEARKKNIDPEVEIFNCLSAQYYGIIDTHYVGYSKEGLVRGLSKHHLLNLKKIKSIDLILLDLDKEFLLKRRLNNAEKPVFPLEEWYSIEKELEMSRYYFDQYCKDLLIQGLKIFNIDLNETFYEIMERLEWQKR